MSVTYTLDILRPFVNDVKLGISLDKTAGRGASSRAHISDEEATIWLSTNLIRNGRKQRTVALLEFRLIWVGSVLVVVSRELSIQKKLAHKVVGGILSFQKR